MNTFLNTLVLAFVAIDPIALIPAFAGISATLSMRDRWRLAWRATVIATLVLLGFWLLGNPLLRAMGVSLHSFRIVGGLLLMTVAFEMVLGRRSGRRMRTVEKALDDAALSSLATFPVAIPLIAGPAAITLVMLIPQQAGPSVLEQSIAFATVLLVVALSGVTMLVASWAASKIGVTVSIALQRILGLLLGALAIEFVISGIRGTFGV